MFADSNTSIDFPWWPQSPDSAPLQDQANFLNPKDTLTSPLTPVQPAFSNFDSVPQQWGPPLTPETELFSEVEVSSLPTPTQTASRESSPVPNTRRGPGRPPKALRADLNKPFIGSNKAARRYFHNESAIKSRAKFNGALEELWMEVPETERKRAVGKDLSRQVSRAEKVQVALCYLRTLRRKVENRRCGDY